MQRGSTAATSAGAEASGSGPPAKEQAGAPIEAVAGGFPCSTTAEVYYPSFRVKRWLDQEMERLKREGQAVGATGLLLGVSEPYTVHSEPPLEYTVIYLFSKKPTRSALQRFARQLAEGAEVPVIVCPSSSSYPSSIADMGASFNVNVPLAAGSAYALKRASSDSEGADVEHWTTEEIPSSPSAEVGSAVHTSNLELAAKKAHAPAEALKLLIASTISLTVKEPTAKAFLDASLNLTVTPLVNLRLGRVCLFVTGLGRIAAVSMVEPLERKRPTTTATETRNRPQGEVSVTASATPSGVLKWGFGGGSKTKSATREGGESVCADPGHPLSGFAGCAWRYQLHDNSPAKSGPVSDRESGKPLVLTARDVLITFKDSTEEEASALHLDVQSFAFSENKEGDTWSTKNHIFAVVHKFKIEDVRHETSTTASARAIMSFQEDQLEDFRTFNAGLAFEEVTRPGNAECWVQASYQQQSTVKLPKTLVERFRRREGRESQLSPSAEDIAETPWTPEPSNWQPIP